MLPYSRNAPNFKLHTDWLKGPHEGMPWASSGPRTICLQPLAAECMRSVLNGISYFQLLQGESPGILIVEYLLNHLVLAPQYFCTARNTLGVPAPTTCLHLQVSHFILYRLGAMWKSMRKEDKDKYFALAREVDAEHKRKYPGK